MIDEERCLYQLQYQLIYFFTHYNKLPFLVGMAVVLFQYKCILLASMKNNKYYAYPLTKISHLIIDKKLYYLCYF
ncbi:hypothetical protein, partial [Staphylococcus simulans]|uniref:hypothetical protein n=1 Tax=Staphylococcus simulans TaxID=1286 RepID=UPI0036D36B61